MTQFANNLDLRINKSLICIFLGELFSRLLKRSCTPDEIVKRMLNLSYPLSFKFSKELFKPTASNEMGPFMVPKYIPEELKDHKGQLTLEILKYDPWAPKKFEGIINPWLILSSLPFALKVNNINYKIPNLIINDYSISSFHPVLLNNFIYDDNNAWFNELDRKSWIKEDRQLIYAVLASKNKKWKSWFYDWIWTAPVFIFNSLVQSGEYNAKNLLIELIKHSSYKNYENWIVIACLYKWHNLRFNLTEYAKLFEVSKIHASYNGFKNRKIIKNKKEFRKLIINKINTLKRNKSKHSYLYNENNSKVWRELRSYGRFISGRRNDNLKWENKLLELLSLMWQYKFKHFMDKYYYEIGANFSDFVYNIRSTMSIFEADISHTNEDFIFLIDDLIMNKNILEYDSGELSINNKKIIISPMKSLKEYNL